jgi:hypothetical protein
MRAPVGGIAAGERMGNGRSGTNDE